MAIINSVTTGLRSTLALTPTYVVLFGFTAVTVIVYKPELPGSFLILSRITGFIRDLFALIKV
jgi:hypothetical protein